MFVNVSGTSVACPAHSCILTRNSGRSGNEATKTVNEVKFLGIITEICINILACFEHVCLRLHKSHTQEIWVGSVDFFVASSMRSN